MDECENFRTIVVRDICPVLDRKNALWTDLVEHTNPKASCPFNMTSMQVSNATLDLSYMDHLALDGFIWTFFFKVFKPIPNVRYKKEILLCLAIESKVTKGLPGKNKMMKKDMKQINWE